MLKRTPSPRAELGLTSGWTETPPGPMTDALYVDMKYDDRRIALYEDVHRRIRASQDKYLAGLVPQAVRVVRGYKGDLYRQLNPALRARRRRHVSERRWLDTTIKFAVPLTEPVWVVRRTRHKFADQIAVGDTFMEPGYASTTTKLNWMECFNGVVWLIRIPAGTAVLTFPDRVDIEHELLLPRGSVFQVEDIPKPNARSCFRDAQRLFQVALVTAKAQTPHKHWDLYS